MAGFLDQLILDAVNRPKQEKAEEAVANARYQRLTPPEDADGNQDPHPWNVNPDQWKAMSRREHIAMNSAYEQQMQDQQTQAKTKEMLAQVQYYGAHGKEMADMGSQRAAQMEADQQVGPAIGYMAGRVAPRMTAPDWQNYYDTTSTEQPEPIATGAPGMSRAQAISEMMKRYPAAAGSRNFNDSWNSVMGAAKYGQAGEDGGDAKVTQLDAGNGETVPFISWNKGRSGQVSPAYGLNLRQQNAIDLIAAKNEFRTALSPKDLLASYQKELVALDNPLSWIGTTPEQRATHRAEINAAVSRVRGEAGATEPVTPAGKTSATTAAPADIAYLKAHPEIRAKFEDRFGKGSAAKYIQ
jgi:hypothetical protein